MNDLKSFFKPEFAKGLTGTAGKDFKVESLSSGAVGKFISLYGLDDLIGSLPDTLESFSIQNRDSKETVKIELPQEIGNFKNLVHIITDNVSFRSIPESICELKKLKFLAVMKNPELTTIPECIANLPKLMFLILKKVRMRKSQVQLLIKVSRCNLVCGIWGGLILK
jgi:hypothetical protein